MSNCNREASCYNMRKQEDKEKNKMNFYIQQNCTDMSKSMASLWRRNILCDVSLKSSDGDTFKAHRCALAATSAYFYAMFCSCCMRECRTKSVHLKAVNSASLKLILNFVYTSEIEISETNICKLLPAACMLQMTHIINACTEFLELQLDFTNCIGISEFAKMHGCNDLWQKAERFISEHFTDMSDNIEFLRLSEDRLLEIIGRDELNIRCETEVFETAMAWLNYDLRYKKLSKFHGTSLQRIFETVRCDFLPPQYIHFNIDNKNSFINSSLPQAAVEYLKSVISDLFQHRPVLTRRRQNPRLPPVIYTVGGYHSQSLSSVEVYNPHDTSTRISLQCEPVMPKTWKKITSMPMPRSGVVAAVLHGILYVIGGRNNNMQNNVDSANVDCYDPVTNTWRRCSSMNIPRNRAGVASIDATIYILGGSNGNVHLSSVEIYDPVSETWEEIAEMHCKRIGLGVAAVNRLIYAVGGFDGEKRLSSVEFYHPELKAWKRVASMSTPRSGAGVDQLNGFIYAVGGYNSSHHQLSSVERYDVKLDQWQTLTSLQLPRSALTIAVLNQRIYALGGYNGTEFLSSVEFYDLATDRWRYTTAMSCGRSGHAVCIAQEPCSF